MHTEPEQHAPAVDSDPDWPLAATRWAQITLAEDDPEHFDADFWLQLMRDSKSNATCISAGGYVAYYPTQLEYHHRSKYLGDTDPFGTLVDGARKLGMSVMARVDPHAIHADAAAAHPEWLARDRDGNPIEHWAYPGIWLTCAFTPYHREFVTEVIREIVREYDVDAVFANRWEGYYGISYSEGAQRSFRDDTGLELPAAEYAEGWPEYVAWRRRRLSELVGIWDQAVRDIRPHARFIPNLGALAARDLDRDLAEPLAPLFIIDKQGRSGTEAPWAAGRNGKRNRGVFPDRPVRLITSVGPEHTVPLEGLGRAGRGNEDLDRRRVRARCAALVHQVQREHFGSPLGAADRRGVQPARDRRAGTEESADHRRGRSPRPDPYRSAPRRRPGPRGRLLPCARRGAGPVRVRLRSAPVGGAAQPVQGDRPRERRATQRRAVRGPA